MPYSLPLILSLLVALSACTETEFGGSTGRRAGTKGQDQTGRTDSNPFGKDQDVVGNDDRDDDGEGGGSSDPDFDMGENVEEDDDDNDDPIREFEDDDRTLFMVKPVEPEQ